MMKNIKIYTSLLVCLFLQAVSVSVYAQCDVTMTATTTPSNCFQSGTITATISAGSGTNLSNINLAACELQLVTTSGTEITQWATWPQVGSNANVRILSGVASGTYLVKFQAICNVYPYTTATASTTVTVGGSYSTFSASVLTLQKSMSCRPTGQISINISGGKAPYNIRVTSAPAGYAGSTNFNITRTSDTIKNVPGGAYTIVITDSCGTSVTRDLTGTDMTLASDVPTSTLYPYLRATSTNDCNTAIPYSSYGVGSDWSYYWSNSSQFYEYAYVVGTGTPSFYTPLPNNDKRPVVTLTGYDYNSFCNSGTTITSYVKPIGCNVKPTTVMHNTSSYLCNTSTAITDPKTYVIIGNCDSIYLETSLNELVGMCYPVSWKIEDTATHVIARSGTLKFPDKNISSKYGYSYKRGVTYKITATDASGRVFTAYWTAAGSSPAAMKIDVTYASGYYCKESPGVGGRDIRIYVDAEDRIYPGTIIKYVSGPQDLAMGPPGSADTLPLSYNYTNFYPNSYIRSTAGKKIMKAGTYVFEIITDSSLCLHPTKRTMSYKLAPYYSIENSNFTYTTMPNCNGLEVKMDGYIKLIDSLGVATNTNTYYRIVSGPPGVTINTTNRAQVGTSSVVTLPWMPGAYIIGVNYSTSVGCQVYEFPVQVDLAERLHIDPFATSHYVCAGKVVGDIYVKAAAGMPNTTLYPPSGYRYTITAAGTTTPILSQNNTGNFENFGAANTLYDIKVEDDCGSFILSNVRMLDLNSANVAFALNDGKYCENQNVEIFCVSLGEAIYSWTGPGGFTSNLQFPKFPAATAQDGTYTVTVSPARCSNPSTGSVNIEIVHPQAPPLEVHNVTVCKSITSTSTVDVVNLSGATPAPNCTLNWYDSYGLPMAPPTAVSNYRTGSYAGEQIIYYVSQVERGTCESDRIPVILTIIANCGNTPSLTVNAPSNVCAGNTGVLTVSGMVFGDILFGGFAHGVTNVNVPPVTATNPSGTLIVKFESDGSVTSTGVDLSISCTGISGGGGSSPIYRIPVVLASPLTITACSGRVQNTLQADTNQYQNNNHGYIVINPATPGAKVTVSGTADVEANYDYLTIYDGITTLPSGSSGLSAGHWISNNPSIAIVSGNTIIPVGSGSVTFSYVSGNGVFTTSAVNVLGPVKISYPNGKNTFCTNESGTKLMSVNGATPMSGTGITSSIAVSPALGLSIVTTSGSTIGTITPSTSTVGTYRIIYTLTTLGCDSKDTTWVTIDGCDNFLRGTVFPFVHEMIEGGLPNTEFNKLFPVVAKLYPVPLKTDDPVDEILNGIPLYVDTAVYYDGSIFVPGTPKNPGQMGRTNNPGLPINWSMLGKTQGMVDTISLKKSSEVPTAPVGLYTFTNVPAGDYVLVLSRSGYMMRFGKITVSGKGQVLGHRELIPGDINGDFIINSFDASLINAKTSSIGTPKYDPYYDLNASGTIDINDVLLVNFYLGFTVDMYEETMDWLLGY